ncbi:hypothetical protein [Sorangium sp. So ce302]|uniref:hypothetical protein n=1 Tax=Sorangium sp. So ce302 TaxID=3133297 RepID=UPI003F5DBB7D
MRDVAGEQGRGRADRLAGRVQRDPGAERREASALGPPVLHRDAARVRIEPFDAIELDLSVLWAK